MARVHGLFGGREGDNQGVDGGEAGASAGAVAAGVTGAGGAAAADFPGVDGIPMDARGVPTVCVNDPKTNT